MVCGVLLASANMVDVMREPGEPAGRASLQCKARNMAEVGR